MNDQDIQNLIKELLEKIKVNVESISLEEKDGLNKWFSIEVKEPHFFISNDAEALYALNHLVRRMVEKNLSGNPLQDSERGEGVRPEGSILIDINGFQKKRVENTQAIAHMMSERARYFKANVEVDPMSAFERRIVHEFLSNATDLKTESMGFGPSRRVVIKYVGTI